MLPSLPIEPEMFYTRNSAYVTDMGKEESLRTDKATHEGAVWASNTQPGYELLYGELDSTTYFLGASLWCCGRNGGW